MDGRDTSDMAYVTSGYAPLTGRLVQATLTQGGISQGVYSELFLSNIGHRNII